MAVGLGLLVAPCAAGAALDVRKTVAFCNQFNLVAASDRGLGQYSNTQIENGVCMLSKIDVQLIGQSAPQHAQDVCMAATESVFLEFKRRFPNRNAKETTGRC
jgi:hypothetical protein